MAVSITISGLEESRRKLERLVSAQAKKEMMEYVAVDTLEFVRDYIADVAPKHHKVADRLGAPHTNHLEDAPGRTDLENVTDKSFTVSIKKTPGLLRAFGPVTIRPKKAKALTIPIHRDAYAKSVAELKSEGRVLFRIKSKKGNALLAESDGTKKGIRPLYVLVKKTVVPEDKSLLPSKEKLEKSIAKAVNAKMREMAL